MLDLYSTFVVFTDVMQEDEESVADGVELGKGGGFMQRREAELKAAQEEALRLKMVTVTPF